MFSLILVFFQLKSVHWRESTAPENVLTTEDLQDMNHTLISSRWKAQWLIDVNWNLWIWWHSILVDDTRYQKKDPKFTKRSKLPEVHLRKGRRTRGPWVFFLRQAIFVYECVACPFPWCVFDVCSYQIQRLAFGEFRTKMTTWTC